MTAFGPRAQAQTNRVNPAEIKAVEQEQASRTPVQKKIASQLIYAARTAAGGVPVKGAPLLRSSAVAEPDGRFKVRMTAAVSPELLAFVKAQGGEVLSSFPAYRAIYAVVPVSRLETLAARADVEFIGIPQRALKNSDPRREAVAAKAVSAIPALTDATGPATSEVDTAVNDPEGDAAHGAKAVRTQYSATGAGVKVGVLSDSINDSSNSYATAVNKGYVSSVTVLSGQAGAADGEAEGLAMLEIVHRITPGAQLYFATGFNGPEQFAQNIKDLASAGCKVIIDDVSYGGESPFQDGVIAQAVDAVSAQGVLFFSSAANNGNLDSGTSSCWEGDFQHGSGSSFLDFSKGASDGPYELNKVQSYNDSVDVALFWAEPEGGATSQYNLYEADSGGHIVKTAAEDVSTTKSPIQYLSGVTPGDYIAVSLQSGDARYLHIDIVDQNSSLNLATSGRTRGHNACGAANAFCLAATPAATAESEGAPVGPYPNVFNASNQIETFSDDGYRHIFFNPNGSAITPGNLTSSGGKVLAKPDFAAADGVTTSVPAIGGNGRPFFGTSAAAPHAGALAALLMSHLPNLTPAQVGAALRAGVVKPSDTSENARDYGTGILLAAKIFTAAGGGGSDAPTITSFSPASGPVGSTVIINGTKFTGLSSVVFGGNVPAAGTFNDTKITVTVPKGAVTGRIKVTTANGSATTASDFTVKAAGEAPTITSAASASGTVGKAFSYQIVASNSPTSYAASGLPAGLSTNHSTGLISGTPTAAAAGSHTVTLQATNATGTGTKTLTLTIAAAASEVPVITSESSASAKVGAAFSYQITATHSPTSYAAAGLPGGLSTDHTTGLISGKPTSAGTYSVTLKAANATGTGTKTLTLTITAASAVPVITSESSASAKVGAEFSYQITATNSPTSYAAAGLPGGLSTDHATGSISGKPTSAGTYSVTLKAANATGTGTKTLTLTVTTQAAPHVYDFAPDNATVGSDFFYFISATNNPTSYGATGLPTGLSVNTSTGEISGTPKVAGTYPLTLSASNSAGKGTAKVTLTVLKEPAPVVNDYAPDPGKVGDAFFYYIVATNDPTSYGATGLPSGLGVNTKTGEISGTPKVAGSYKVTLSASNSTGKGTAVVTIVVKAK